MTDRELVERLHCQRFDCEGCPMRYEEQVEQDLFRICCAAQDAALLIERRILHEQ